MTDSLIASNSAPIDMPIGSGAPLAPADMLAMRAEQLARLFQSGQMQRWYELINLADDFSLMNPFGGPTDHGFNASPESLAALASRFPSGTATITVEASYAVDDMVVLAITEHCRGIVHAQPEQDWTLRVTLVFRRHGTDWQLVHRHADPLSHRRSAAATAALARGPDAHLHP